MQSYAGIDLHASKNFIGIVDEKGERAFKRKLPNHPGEILLTFGGFQGGMVGVVLESTFNWHRLVDLLGDAGCRVHPADPSAIQKYSRPKHADDEHDAFRLAEMLLLVILPEGYVYPKEERPIRDLPRKRGHPVKLRTSLLLSPRNMVDRNRGVSSRVNDAKRVKENVVARLLEENEDLAMAPRAPALAPGAKTADGHDSDDCLPGGNGHGELAR